jgi:transcriptional regulator with XRE-family HTH domain
VADFGDLLRTKRKAACLSQRGLALRLATREQYSEPWLDEIESLTRSIRRWEKGSNVPGGRMMLRLSAALGLLATDDEDEEE